uniref:Uncharacterized protein n=1 Tax=Solanum lycopersicum TaxID=4081 RepID=A0A3Q7GHP2_SOLLC
MTRKATLESSMEIEALVYSSDISNGSNFYSWEADHGCPYMYSELRKSSGYWITWEKHLLLLKAPDIVKDGE